MWRVRVWGACCLLASLPAGCRSPWEAFQQIEIGKPVPEDAIIRTSARRGRFEWVLEEADLLKLPAIWATGSVRVIEDGRGNVAAKEYEAMALGHWLVAQTAAWRWVVEFQVPEHAWRDPPRGWEPPSLDEWSEARERSLALANVLEALPDEGHDPFRMRVLGPDVRDSLEAGICYDTHAFSIAPRRVSKRVRDLIDGGEKSVAIDLAKDIDLDGVPGAKEADWRDIRARVYIQGRPELPTLLLEIAVSVVSTRRPGNVLEWLLYLNDVHDTQLPEAQEEPTEADNNFAIIVFYAFGFYNFSHNGVIGRHELEEMPELFDGVTKDGFDRTYRNAWGGSCRIRNLGDRRVRVETNQFEITDGLMLLAWLKFGLLCDD